ncbi:hypothetical protein Zmor_022066 [Zophobas morio]|uniref:Uncharacterized protein n=1 Tax=Zophobas morio TaxID=2755281 RepID=A0AA38HJS9_9CUCU|nr:hypothetical protein Zmor_022066 [Zophobas morio]
MRHSKSLKLRIYKQHARSLAINVISPVYTSLEGKGSDSENGYDQMKGRATVHTDRVIRVKLLKEESTEPSVTALLNSFEHNRLTTVHSLINV